MLKGLRSAIYPVADPQAAAAWYEALLDTPPYFTSEQYVGFEVGGFELGLLQAGSNSTLGVRTMWGVADIEASLGRLVERGGKVLSPVTSVGDGIKTADIEDPFGNRLGIIENSHFDIGKCG